MFARRGHKRQRNKTAAMISQASQRVSAARGQSDEDALTFNCRNATLRFVQRVGIPSLLESRWTISISHDLADMISRVAEVNCDRDPHCPTWGEHRLTVPPDPSVRRFFQTVIGHAITGDYDGAMHRPAARARPEGGDDWCQNLGPKETLVEVFSHWLVSFDDAES
jgi:hypothetical protein